MTWTTFDRFMNNASTPEWLRWWYTGVGVMHLYFSFAGPLFLTGIVFAGVFFVAAMHCQIAVRERRCEHIAHLLLRGTT